MRTIKIIATTIIIGLAINTGFSQGVGINNSGAQPDPSAMLDISSDSRGVLIPRMTQAQRDAISAPAVGLEVFNTDTDCFNFWNGTTWRQSCYDCDFTPPTIGNNGPICEGSTLNLTASSISGATYSWTGPNAFSSSQQNPSIANVTTSASGVYSLVVTLSGCSSSPITMSVTINATPQTPTASSNSPVCVGSNLNLSAGNVVGATYSWTGPNGFTANTQNPIYSNVTLADAGTYNVIATVNGCASAAGTTTVTVNANPSAPVAGNDSPVCVGNTLNLTASAISGASYSWTGPNGFTDNSQNPSRSNMTAGDAGTYSVTATVNGCTGPAGTTSVTVTTVIPGAPTAGSNSPVCEGTTLNLTASTVGGATYSWTGPNGFSSTSQNPSVSNITSGGAGTYTVTATVNGCTSTGGSANVIVDAATSGSQTFSYTGSQQTFTVPNCIYSVSLEVWGAQGGAGPYGGNDPGGEGGYAIGDLAVSPGQTLYVYVGGKGTDNGGPGGWNGGGIGGSYGGGGGGTDVRVGGTTYSDRVIVGGGGGGSTGLSCPGGDGGGTNGQNGTIGSGCSGQPDNGGKQNTGGNGNAPGGFGYGGDYNTSNYGGGGGGWWGGGAAHGSGGGSGYIGGVTSGSMTVGGRSGNGQAIISW